jgi:hypothetical protein
MSRAQLARFDCFFNEHYPTILAEVGESDPSGAVRRTRSGFASAYRFWRKVEADGDPVGWIHRVIAEDRRSTRRGAGRKPLDESSHQAVVDSNAERRRILSLARRQRAAARAVIGTSALVALGAELLVVHR